MQRKFFRFLVGGPPSSEQVWPDRGLEISIHFFVFLLCMVPLLWTTKVLDYKIYKLSAIIA